MACLKRSSRDAWWDLWQSHINKLKIAMMANRLEADCLKLLNDCFDAYKKYLHETSKDEALGVISGAGCTPIEIAFMWMGRWRPTSGIVLVYSAMGLDPLVAAKGCIKNAVQHSSFGHTLNEQQLSGLNALQAHAFRAESNISKQLAVIQMLLVEQNAVSMLHLEEPMSDKKKDLSDFQKLIDARLLELQSLLRMADDLRLHTLRELLDLLVPAQGAFCLVRAFEIVFSLRSLTTFT
ncbi:hypothetical protein L7F22_056325 [Adiantum nelumboides]|nr:hypothetical protein [Adiantum nelumboides]